MIARLRTKKTVSEMPLSYLEAAEDQEGTKRKFERGGMRYEDQKFKSQLQEKES